MSLFIAQVQGRLALTDSAGTVLGVFDDAGDLRLQVEALLKAGHGLATEATLATRAAEATLATRATEATLAAIKDTAGIKKITDPVTVMGIDVFLSSRATEATLASVLVELTAKTEPTDTQLVSAAALPLPTGAATEATLATRATEATLALIKAKTDNLDVALSTRAVTGLTDAQLRAAAVPVSVAAVPLPAGAATEATLATRAAASQLPAALIGGRLDENVGAWFGSTAPTVGQKAMAASIPVVLASDQATIPVTVQSPAGASTGISTGRLVLGGGTAGTLNAIRATAYTEQAVNAQRSISSSSASDTAAGVGARTVLITYFDATGAGPFTEIVTLAGVAAVNTVSTTICFIESMVVLTVGTTARNVGTITLFAAIGGGGGAIGTIGVGSLVAAQGDNRTLWAHHYVAAGKIASLATYVVSAESGGSGTNATFFLRSRAIPAATNAEIMISDLLLVSGPLVRALAFPIKVVGPARVVAYGVPGGNGTTLNASFDFSEV